MTIEERLKAARHAAGLTLGDLARISGLDKATLSRAENGRLRLSGPNRDKAEAWLGTLPEPQEQSMAIPHQKKQIAAVCRINGMGEPDAAGSYVRLIVTEPRDAPQHRPEFLAISEGNAAALAAELLGATDAASPPAAIEPFPAEPLISIEADRAIVERIVEHCGKANALVAEARRMGLDVRLPTIGQEPFRVVYAGRPYVDQSRNAIEGRGPIGTTQLANRPEAAGSSRSTEEGSTE